MRFQWLRFLVALAMSAIVVAAGAAPALALSAEIAYRCDLDICLVDPDVPSAVTNLTDNGNTSLEDTPVWSPDGKRVAFVSTFGNGARNIFVMTPGATGNAVNLATQLTFYAYDGGGLTDPVWSRDGTKVAFERKASYASPVGVFVVAGDGTTLTPVTITADGAHPTWSPDGTKIAFSKGEQVYIAGANGIGPPVPLANAPGHSPEWSPDGTKIAFDGINAQEHDPFVDLHVVSAAGAGTPVVTPINYTQWTFAAWSPDGTRLAYRATAGNDGYIRVGRGDGSQDLGLATAVNQNDYAPSWSPDGLRVVVEGYRYSLPDPMAHSNEIYVANADGSGAVRAITTGGKNAVPAWRPDPLRTPFVPILTPPGLGPTVPSGGSPTPTPTRLPTIVWITKRIPYVPGSQFVFVGLYGCSGPVCNVASTGTARAVGPPRTSAVASKPRKQKSELVVIGHGHMQVPSGATRQLKLKLTRAGIALLRRRGNVTVTVTVTTTGPARPTVTTRHEVRVAVTKPTKRKHKR